MGDQLLTLVPRTIEIEPGHVDTEMFWSKGANLLVSKDANGAPQAFLEPISGRWIGTPNGETDTTLGWTVTSGHASDEVSPQGNVGVAIVEEGTSAAPC